MNSPSLGFNRDLWRDNRRRVCGLSDRWSALHESYSIGADDLRQKTEAYEADHHDVLQQLIETQRDEFNRAITLWDSDIDQELGRAEQGTLLNLREEQEALIKERAAHKKARTKEIASFEQLKQQLRTRIELAREKATKIRDSEIGKIQRELQLLTQRMREAREWIGAKSSNPVLVHWTSHDPPSRAQEISQIDQLKKVTSEFEAVKQQILKQLDDLQGRNSLRLVSVSLLIVLGLLFGTLAAWIAYLLQTPPLIWVAAGLSAGIVIPALIALGTSPLITRTLKQLFPPIVDLEKEAQLILQRGRQLIDHTCQNEYAKLEIELKTESLAIETTHVERLEQIDARHREEKERIVANALRHRTDIAAARVETVGSIDRNGSTTISELRKTQKQAREERARQHTRELSRMRKQFEDSQTSAVHRWKKGVQFVADRIHEQWKSIQYSFPPWKSTEMLTGEWPRDPTSLAWPIGSIGIGAKIAANDSPETLYQPLQEMGRFPILFDLLHHGNLVIDADVGSRTTAHSMVRQLLLRAITSLPAGSMQVTVIDPEGLGKEFSWMMQLADVDPQLVTHRAWTQPLHIAHQLELAARHVEDVIQQSLRNRFRTLADYNQQAGAMAIPYRILVWSGFPLGLDEHSWQSLCSLLASGGRCGVGLILRLAENCTWPPFIAPEKIREHGMIVELRSDPKRVSLCNSGFDDATLDLVPAPDESDLQIIMEHQLNDAKNIGKRIVPFASIAPDEGDRFTSSSADGLEIPIGISESGRMQSLTLGTGTAQHVLIAGKTGSGKSSLLHTMITSSALRYSPEQLRMVLLDFKKGVEFQIYAERHLPHADIIGIESRREFGLSVLEYLDRVLSARGEAFRSWGVQDLPSLKRKYPEITLPRILIVIDEFQELFVEDDKLSQQASLLVDRLVRQGRSFGMHLVLASQTLGGSYSLPRTTLAQMAVRIALQCDSSDAMLILSEDNNAAERLRHSGQGIYNDAGGRIEGNHNFQVSFLGKPEQTQWLQKLPAAHWSAVPTINPIGKQIVFEGHKPSRWDESNARAALLTVPETQRSQGLWILGESVSIEPPVLRSFPPVAGRNAMLVGNDSSIVAGLVASWIRTTQAIGDDSSHGTRFVILDGSVSDDIPMSKVMHWAKNVPPNVHVGNVRELDATLQEIHDEWNRRAADPDSRYPTLIFFIANLSRFREFRRSDEFSFSSHEGELKPDSLLTKLLSEGPTMGIHVCIWSDTPTTLSRWLPRNALRDIEIRILQQMSASDSNQLIDSSLAHRLDRYVLLAHDDSDGKSVKFRPYELDSLLD